MHHVNDNDALAAFPLIDGPLSGQLRQFCRHKIVVERMAADLVKADSFRDKRKAMATLLSLRGADGASKYPSFFVFSQAGNAMHAAEQMVVAAEMSEP
jgi:hypothetical protein